MGEEDRVPTCTTPTAISFFFRSIPNDGARIIKNQSASWRENS